MDQTARRLFEVPTLSARNKWKEKWGGRWGCNSVVLVIYLFSQVCSVLFTVNEMLRKCTVKHNSFTKVLEYSVRDQTYVWTFRGLMECSTEPVDSEHIILACKKQLCAIYVFLLCKHLQNKCRNC
jgi:hypothetical protein